MRLICVIYLIFLSTTIFADEGEFKSKLIIFVNSEKTVAASHFEQKALPEIKKLVEEKKIPIEIIDTSHGLPSEITTVPTIAFISPTGRSIYQGRYLTFDRIGNFIETSQNIPQTEVVNTFKNLPVINSGRAIIGVPIKICDVTGTKPNNYDKKAFIDQAFKVVMKEMHGYELKTEIHSNRTDKFFYFDFYPWVSDNGQLFLSAAIFSQNHCKNPIWTTEKSPFVGGWGDRNILFQQATARMEEEIKKNFSNSLIGDAFDIVPKTVKTITWEDLGVKNHDKKKSNEAITKAEIATEWEIDSVKNHHALVQFRLAPPNENYSGFAKKINGELKFANSGAEKKLQGNFSVSMDSVTMGEADLDAALFAKDMLNVKGFPRAKFEFDTPIDSENFSIYFGKESILDVNGKFTFKDKTIPLKVELVFEPIVKNGVTQLVGKANFRFDLKEFGLTGAPGDTPEKDIIEFFITLVMVQK